MLLRTTGQAGGLLVVMALVSVGCTSANPNYCEKEGDCSGGRVCSVLHSACVWPDAAVGSLDSAVDSRDEIDAAADSPFADDAGQPVDGLNSAEVEKTDGTNDAGVIDGTGPDVGIVDGAGTCAVDGDCTDPAQSFCVAGACTGCQNVATDACGVRVCDLVSGQCVECSADSQCTEDPAKGFCVANACVGCNASGATGCAEKTDGKTVCATTGVCVECAADNQCTKDPAKGFCVANACVGCDTSGATGCAARADGKTLCATTGIAAGQCVECLADSQCTKDPAKGFCVANACAGCQLAPANACSTRSAAKPACGATGMCVECATSADCTVMTKPICTSTTCGACTADSQCVEKLGATPGVCMSPIDGHCATDAETVYVGTSDTVTCSESNAGTAQAPVCSAANGVGIAKSKSKSLIVVRGESTAGSTTIAVSAPLTIVGKNNALLAPAFASNDAIDITSGEVYLRGLTVQGGSSTGIGINATPGLGSTVTLHTNSCTVANNPGGGILLNGAAFDIENTTVTGNGPGTFNGLTTWGGILINNPPTSGPTTLTLVTIKNNQQVGLSCSASIAGTGVLATGNEGGVDINPTCSVTSCTPDAGTACGAQ